MRIAGIIRSIDVDLDGREITFFNDASRDLFFSYLKKSSTRNIPILLSSGCKLKWSKVEYEIRLDGTPPSQTSEGLTYALGNQNTNKIVVQVYDTGMTNKRQQISTLGHELRHALQFDRGQLAFAYSGNDEEPWQPRYYSNAHEVDAFMAQALLSGGTMYTKWHVTNTTFQQRLSLLPASYSSRSGGSLNYLPSFLPSINGTPSRSKMKDYQTGDGTSDLASTSRR